MSARAYSGVWNSPSTTSVSYELMVTAPASSSENPRKRGGYPGPVIEQANGRRAVYFLVPACSTAHRAWPDAVTRLTTGPNHISYVPIPALDGTTWPLSWRHAPTSPCPLVHTLPLRTALHCDGSVS
jgi:hypothetical protein